MDDEQPLNNTPTTSFSLPLTRFPSRLLAGDDDEESFSGESSCVYSKPIVVLDVVWNLAFVVVSAMVLISTFDENPSTPLRLWVCGYAFQCLLHVGFVSVDYRPRTLSHLLGCASLSLSQTRTRIMKKLESVNTVVSSVWWMFGFYWIIVGGQALLQDSPRLYWLTVIFLAFDVFFIIFCIGMALLIFFALCFCVPVIAFIYSMVIRDGASDDDIRNLPKYTFHQDNSSMILENDKKLESLKSQFELGNTNHTDEFTLSPEDSECCICLSHYVDGAELYTLPCSHHFHCRCISKWLRINATCPLCKFNILRRDTLV